MVAVILAGRLMQWSSKRQRRFGLAWWWEREGNGGRVDAEGGGEDDSQGVL